MANEKKVLVKFGDSSRAISFWSDGGGDGDVLLKLVKHIYRDKIPENRPVILQIRDEEWFGEFVDINPGSEIPTKSIIKVVVEKNSLENSSTDYTSLSSDNVLPLPDRSIPVTEPDLQMEKVSAKKNTEAYISQKAILYGANNSSLVLTQHQQEMNKASQQLALSNPALLHDRRKLMHLARIKVDEDGYVYKHGKSRSKHLRPLTDSDTASSSFIPKRSKTTETERLQRISFIDENVNDIKTQIGFKEKRREQLANAHNYGECEKISDEIRGLKKSQFEFQVELSKLKRQQQQHDWYKQNKKKKKFQTSQAVTSDVSDTESMSSLSSRSTTPVSPDLVPSISCVPQEQSNSSITTVADGFKDAQQANVDSVEDDASSCHHTVPETSDGSTPNL